jgi:hypothetical protein
MNEKQKHSPVEYSEITGRKKELNETIKRLQSGQSVALIAPRRFGKTALLQQVLKEVKGDQNSAVFIDLLAKSTSELLSNALIKETLKNHKLHKEFLAARISKDSFYSNEGLRNIVAAFPHIARMDDISDAGDLLSECLDFPNALSLSLNQRMFCGYDNFGNSTNSDPGGKLTKLITKKTGQHTNTSYLFAGRNESVFLPQNKTYLIQLGYIENQWLIESLNKKFARLKIKLPKKYVAKVVSFTKGHPYYTQLAFYQTILANALNGTAPKPKELISQLLSAERGYIEKVWEDLTHNKEYLLSLLALSEGSENIYQRLKSTKINVARAQKNLEGMGYLMKKESGGYTIADPLLEYWLRKNS